MTTVKKINESAKTILRRALPLRLRKRICIELNRSRLCTHDQRYWWTRELLKDFAKNDRDEYHRYLWSNHLAYSLTYEVSQRFGEENMIAPRKQFFGDLLSQLRKMNVIPERDVGSVFEVGCSLGHQLRYLEKNLFTAATDIAGIDIDQYAIEEGRRHLQDANSTVQLISGDMANLEALLDDKQYDIFICSGVLMYMAEKDAARVLKVMLDHSRLLVALSDPGNPQFDNGLLDRSLIREHDGSRFHNLDAMVDVAGGRVLYRRWEGQQMVDGQRLYFIFAAK